MIGEGVVRLSSSDARGKEIYKNIAREEYDLMNAPDARAAMDVLSKFRKNEETKVMAPELDEEYKNSRLEEIKARMQEMSEGDYEAPRAFLVRETLGVAEKTYGISAKNLDELRERIAGAQGPLKEQIVTAEEQHKELKKQLTAAQKAGKAREIMRLEAEVMKASTALSGLRRAAREDFADLRRLLETIDGLDRSREKA